MCQLIWCLTCVEMYYYIYSYYKRDDTHYLRSMHYNLQFIQLLNIKQLFVTVNLYGKRKEFSKKPAFLFSEKPTLLFSVFHAFLFSEKPALLFSVYTVSQFIIQLNWSKYQFYIFTIIMTREMTPLLNFDSNRKRFGCGRGDLLPQLFYPPIFIISGKSIYILILIIILIILVYVFWCSSAVFSLFFWCVTVPGNHHNYKTLCVCNSCSFFLKVFYLAL